MYLKQKDIFWAMNKEFVKEVMDIAVTESHQQGEWLFHGGDPANAFYILLKGRVKLILGETGHVVYIVSNAGEAFGWSSLIDRGSFSASAGANSAPAQRPTSIPSTARTSSSGTKTQKDPKTFLPAALASISSRMRNP